MTKKKRIKFSVTPNTPQCSPPGSLSHTLHLSLGMSQDTILLPTKDGLVGFLPRLIAGKFFPFIRMTEDWLFSSVC